jgi:phosphoserine phosphatase
MTAAVFFRAEGTLIARGAISATAHLAANGAGFRERALRLGHVALSAPVYSVLGQSDRNLANRIAFLSLRNMTEDRISVLAAEYFEDILRDRILQGGLELLRKARRAGHRVVLISDGIAQVVEPLVAELRHVDDHICNRLELRDGRATGRLLDPVVGGHDSARWARAYADEHGLDLSACYAYACHGPDMLLMSSVGYPCAVNPDFTLRRAARDADWPVMDYHV